MHNAPAVNFPVGRPVFFGVVLGLLWTIGAVAAGYVASLQSQAPLVVPGVLALCVAVAAGAFIQWRKTPNGTLGWDRDQWSFVSAQSTSKLPVALDGVSVHLDFQSVMLVSFSNRDGDRMWLCLDGAADKQRWRALRRAIYARPRHKVGEHLGEKNSRTILDHDAA